MGRCPKCGEPVLERGKGYGCSGWKPDGGGCDFIIWKYDKYSKTKIGEATAKRLLAGETVESRGKTIRLEGGRLKVEKGKKE